MIAPRNHAAIHIGRGAGLDGRRRVLKRPTVRRATATLLANKGAAAIAAFSDIRNDGFDNGRRRFLEASGLVAPSERVRPFPCSKSLMMQMDLIAVEAAHCPSGGHEGEEEA